MQCVEQYVAEQADELSLEPAEIVNVIRKTNEGKNVPEQSRINIGFLFLVSLQPTVSTVFCLKTSPQSSNLAVY